MRVHRGAPGVIGEPRDSWANQNTMTKIKFIKDSHEYLANTGDGVWLSYTSVTTIGGRYSPPFKKDFIAPRVAEANARKQDGSPETTEEVIDSWERSGEVACDYGNAVHGAIENYIKYNVIPKAAYLKELVENFKQLGLGKCVSEKIFFSDEYRVAGTIDILEQIDGKRVRLLDIKTNGELMKVKGKLLSPFDNLANSNFNKYVIQLSIYAYLLSCWGYEVEEAQILHVSGTDITRIDVPLITDYKLIEEVLQANLDSVGSN